MSFTLGRLIPPDWQHVEKYPLTAATAPSKPSVMVIGVSWYPEFDRPYQDGTVWRVNAPSPQSRPRGGHCVALKPRGATDPTTWWDYYDQGDEGRCVQFGISRACSHLNRKQYEIREGQKDDAGRWLYFEGQRHDVWPGGAYPGASPYYEGTSVRSGLEVVIERGIIPKGKTTPLVPEGVSAFRWARNVDDALAVLGYSDKDYVDVLNSWGRNYPHLVRLPAEALARLLKEDGEIAVLTDR